MTDVKFPHVKVRLTGTDGNAFAIMGAVVRAMRKAGVSRTDIDAYRKESMAGDYDHLLQTAAKYVNIR